MNDEGQENFERFKGSIDELEANACDHLMTVAIFYARWHENSVCLLKIAKELGSEYRDVMFYVIDVEKNIKISVDVDVADLPHVIIYRSVGQDGGYNFQAIRKMVGNECENFIEIFKEALSEIVDIPLNDDVNDLLDIRDDEEHLDVLITEGEDFFTQTVVKSPITSS